jgi:hypothetical protein
VTHAEFEITAELVRDLLWIHGDLHPANLLEPVRSIV